MNHPMCKECIALPVCNAKYGQPCCIKVQSLTMEYGKLVVNTNPSTNKARDAICVNEKCHWNLNGICAFVSCCPGRNK